MLKTASMIRFAVKSPSRCLAKNNMIQKNHILTISLIAGLVLASTSIQVQSEHMEESVAPQRLVHDIKSGDAWLHYPKRNTSRVRSDCVHHNHDCNHGIRAKKETKIGTLFYKQYFTSRIEETNL
ncbi:hypothetical protein DSQ19_07510 [Candidatus Nitrosotenuis sp. DW1]|nr:hypothetical protein DSQ19_07510 [Candidatus Nitrosotenuis sp. DW1]